jgi:hypothetical protein
VEHERAAGARGELCPGALGRAGLADRAAVELGDLVAADHERIGPAGGDRARLGLGEARREGPGRFAGLRRFVDIGRDDVEPGDEA